MSRRKLHWTLDSQLETLSRYNVPAGTTQEIESILREYEKLKLMVSKTEFEAARRDPALPFAKIFDISPEKIRISSHDCPYSPNNYCIYLNNDEEACVYCEDPLERK